MVEVEGLEKEGGVEKGDAVWEYGDGQAKSSDVVSVVVVFVAV